jgi:hypothetical protein
MEVALLFFEHQKYSTINCTEYFSANLANMAADPVTDWPLASRHYGGGSTLISLPHPPGGETGAIPLAANPPCAVPILVPATSFGELSLRVHESSQP